MASDTVQPTMLRSSPPFHPSSPLPRVAIQFCTQCKWMLRAAYVSSRHEQAAHALPRPASNHVPTRLSERGVTLSTNHSSFHHSFNFVQLLPFEKKNKREENHPCLCTTIIFRTNERAFAPIQFAQELLSTFSTSLGEVALQPSTGGTFIVTLTHLPNGATSTSTTTTTLWDRKIDGGFPETKELKRRVRDVIEPNRDLGHVDRNHGKPTVDSTTPARQTTSTTTNSPSITTMPSPSSSAEETKPSLAADNLPSAAAAAAVIAHLKKHPANASSRSTEPGPRVQPAEETNSLSDAARVAISAASANKGQQAKAEVSSPAGQNIGELRRQQQQPQQQTTTGDDAKDKQACEDCA